MRRHKTKEDKLDPVIIPMTNQVTGAKQWRVFKKGFYATRGISSPSWSRDFDTREEAIACFADNFGWVRDRDGELFQPTEDDVHVLGIRGDRASG